MTDEELTALKREHDALFTKGCEMLEKLQDMADRVTKLRERIKEAEGADYDWVGLLFGGTFDVDEQSVQTEDSITAYYTDRANSWFAALAK